MFRVLGLGAAMLALAAGVLGTGSFVHQASAQAADPTVSVRAGAGSQGYLVNAFLPERLTVIAGTTVSYKLPWFAGHTITVGTFPTGGAPTASPATYPNAAGYVDSGNIAGDPANPKMFDLKFAEPGTYQIVCRVHPLMRGTVDVLAANSPAAAGVDSQLSADVRAEAELKSRMANLQALFDNTAASLTKSAGPGGTTRHRVFAGADSIFRDVVMQFITPTITVQEGDTIVFENKSLTPHLATFGQVPAGSPFTVPGDKSGQTYTGGNTTSGILQGTPTGITSWEVVMGKAGTYNYTCQLHTRQGMSGTVVVLPKGSSGTGTGTAPLPPRTGSGRTDSDSGITAMAIAVLVLATGGAGYVVARAARRA